MISNYEFGGIIVYHLEAFCKAEYIGVDDKIVPNHSFKHAQNVNFSPVHDPVVALMKSSFIVSQRLSSW